MKKLLIFITLFLAMMLSFAVSTPALAQYGQVSAFVCDLKGPDTTLYVDGTSDSVMASIDISSLYYPGDSVLVVMNTASDTGSVCLDISTATKTSAFASWSDWTVNANGWKTESTDTSFYVTLPTFVRYLGFKIEGQTGNAEDTELMILIAGQQRTMSPKAIVSNVWRGSDRLQTFTTR